MIEPKEEVEKFLLIIPKDHELSKKHGQTIELKIIVSDLVEKESGYLVKEFEKGLMEIQW